VSTLAKEYVEWEEAQTSLELQKEHFEAIVNKYRPYLDLKNSSSGPHPLIARRSLGLLIQLMEDSKIFKNSPNILACVVRSINYQLEKQSLLMDKLHADLQEKEKEVGRLKRKLEQVQSSQEAKIEQLETSLEDLEMNSLDALIQFQRWIEEGTVVKKSVNQEESEKKWI